MISYIHYLINTIDSSCTYFSKCLVLQYRKKFISHSGVDPGLIISGFEITKVGFISKFKN